MITARTKKSDGLYPLSSSQARIWFMEKLDSEITSYNIPLDFRITGNLDIPVLQQSIDHLVRRHPALRTIFPNGNGHPTQKVLRELPSPIRIVNIEAEPEEVQQAIIARNSIENATRKFNFLDGPLFYFELIILGKNEYYFLANFHHLVSDAASVAIFLEELQTVYTSIVQKKPDGLNELTVHYTDYALWEKEWLTSSGFKKQLEYWKNELQGAPELLQLPTDSHRPKMQTYRGAEYHFTLGKELREKVHAISKIHGTSMFVPLMTAYSVLLSRYASQNDLVIGVPVANRRDEAFESIMGVLINTLPVRLTFPESLSFSGAVDHVKQKFLSGYENQEVAFERLVEELKVKRNTGVTPLFQVLFNYLTGFYKEFEMSGARFRMVHAERRSSTVDLTLTISDQKTELDCILEYNTDLFREETMSRLAGHFRTILESATANEHQDIREIPLLTSEEKQLMLGSWNDTGLSYPANKCTHHLFEEQVVRTPDAVALADDHSQFTYAELNARANRLAHYLAAQGACEDTFVAVYLDRSADFITGLLAIAKTGSTYLPLDPIFPKARIGLILDEAKPVILLTQRALADDLPPCQAKTVLIDEPSLFDGEPETNLAFGNPQKAAYILFTSGSTGKPKGVLVKHHSTVNIVRAISRKMEVTEQDVLLSATTFTFDVAEMEMYLPLFNGGKLVMASQATVSNVEFLKQQLQSSGATLFLATPVTFKMLMMSSWEGKPDLKVLSGGEGLPKELAREMLSRCKMVFNGYAPTETTIYSLLKKVNPEDLEGEGYVSLGKPLDNNILYVLNSNKVPVPAGIPGELYIGGAGVSAGYLNLPEHTAERFVRDPLGMDPEAMFYRTGDLVHYTATGDVIFLNRIDFQVKIRGFRIELGEIESMLTQYPGIRENVVVVRTDASGEKMLVAYLIMDDGITLDPAALHQYLKNKLPDYMVPSAFVTMDRFPLTSTLKVDRKALPEPGSVVSASSRKYTEPTTETEKKMAEIWSSLLHIKKIGIHDDFFEIGGHSMIAVSLVVSIEKKLGIRIPLASFFSRSTIFHLSELVDQGADSLQWRSLVPIRPAGIKKPLFLIHGMGLNVLLYTTLVNYLDREQPVYGLQAKGLNGKDEPLDSIEAIATYYISEIITVDPEGPYAMAGFSLGGRIAYEMARQLNAMGKQVRFLGLFDATADGSLAYLPFFERNNRKMIHIARYISWNLSSFFQAKDTGKLTILRRRWKGLKKKIRGLDFDIKNADTISYGKRKELPKYLRKVHHANSHADRNYIIRTYPGTVHLFKASRQTFYIPEPITYGWDKVALGGVVVHEVPGEHSNTFAPPNDKIFANLLQASLNEIENL
ncbi:MAG: amino acid adenylation domain-containing protein [Bacteroidetes bacterium]|nr:amino acid adenylation domain-containing protein [Bacteroidota bacterium]